MGRRELGAQPFFSRACPQGDAGRRGRSRPSRRHPGLGKRDAARSRRPERRHGLEARLAARRATPRRARDGARERDHPRSAGAVERHRDTARQSASRRLRDDAWSRGAPRRRAPPGACADVALRRARAARERAVGRLVRRGVPSFRDRRRRAFGRPHAARGARLRSRAGQGDRSRPRGRSPRALRERPRDAGRHPRRHGREPALALAVERRFVVARRGRVPAPGYPRASAARSRPRAGQR